MIYWFLKYVLVGPLVRLLYRPRIEGAENIPKRGGAILAGNHLSFADSIFLPILAPRRIMFIAKQEYFTGRGVKGVLRRAFFLGTGQVPVDRSGGSTATATLSTGRRLLAEGRLVGIYPEGTRSPDGRLYRGKTGVARMALEAGVPVIPVVSVGTDRVQPPGRIIPRLGRVVVRIGEPLDFSRYEGMAGDRFVERSMTDEIMYALMSLSGQEYVDVYAAAVKAEMARSGCTAREAVERAAARRAANREADEREPVERAG